MTDEEARRLEMAGADPLVYRVAMHPEIPIDYVAAHNAPISVLLQLDVLADSLDRIARRRALLEAHERAKQER